MPVAGRQQILKIYAQQLSQGDLEKLAEACEGMSGRDLRDICEQAERKTASKVLLPSVCAHLKHGVQELNNQIPWV